jgi:glycosyltransferase involved in cell wall biosynthesis
MVVSSLTFSKWMDTTTNMRVLFRQVDLMSIISFPKRFLSEVKQKEKTGISATQSGIQWFAQACLSTIKEGLFRCGSWGNPTRRVTFFPDYRWDNPYQNLLYNEVPGFRMESGTINDARQKLASSAGRDRVFHLHWTAPILGNTKDKAEAAARVELFLQELNSFRSEGGRVIWTIHNILSHECLHKDLEIDLCKHLCEIADFIHVHGRQVPTLAAPYYEIPRRKLLIGPHGSYLGVYPQGITRSDARQELGLAADMTVLLFVGQIRGYKGINQLVAAYRALKSRDPGLRLLIVGRPVMVSTGTLDELVQLDAGIRIEPRRIDDAELQVFFAAADVTVLPYSSVLTSGSAYLSLSFSTPVIAPQEGLLPEVIKDGVNGFLYPLADQFHLEQGLQRYLDLPLVERERMSQSAGKTAATLDWKEAGAELTKAFNLVLGIETTGSESQVLSEQETLNERIIPPLSPLNPPYPALRFRLESDTLREAEVDWWRPGKGGENFGDFLSLLLWNSLFDKVKIKASLYHLVGSVIDSARIRQEIPKADSFNSEPIVFWCCGCRSSEEIAPDVRNRSIFCGVRGPLTRDVLGLPMDTPLGDSGLLLPLIYEPLTHLGTKGRAVCVPHINDSSSEEHLLSVTGAEQVIWPNIEGSLEALLLMIDAICSASFVLAGSLHAAILACAYNVPFCYFDAGHQDVPFKWHDFAASVNIGTAFARNVQEGEMIYRSRIAPNLQRPPLARLLECAPFQVKPELLNKARQHCWYSK